MTQITGVSTILPAKLHVLTLNSSEGLQSTSYHTSLHVFSVIYLLNTPYLISVLIGWVRIT